MSRVLQRSGASDRPPEDGDEECPICHSKRYLNQNMRFLVNPECYHKMCGSCVDRIFSHGPAPCPVAGCRKTLRRNKFRVPTFEDLHLEREVDIRRRVAAVFNRVEDDFESLRDYNDYLNEVEDLTFNLIYNIDVEATTKKLKDYEAANKQAITESLQRARDGAETAQARQAAEREAARLRRMAAVKEEQEAKREREESRRELVEKLASGGDADEIMRQNKREMAKRSRIRKDALEHDLSALDATNGSAFTIRGLKKRVDIEPEKPYDPFGGMNDKRDYFVIQDDYGWDFFDKIKNEPIYNAGGYDVHEYYTRALTEAFSGLGIIIGEGTEGPATAEVATVGAEMAATSRSKVIVDDVF